MERLPPMSVPRSGLIAVYDGMAVFALGGGWTRAIDTHERYDAYANQWSNFPAPSAESGAIWPQAQDGRVSLIGGWSGAIWTYIKRYQSAFAPSAVIRGLGMPPQGALGALGPYRPVRAKIFSRVSRQEILLKPIFWRNCSSGMP